MDAHTRIGSWAGGRGLSWGAACRGACVGLLGAALAACQSGPAGPGGSETPTPAPTPDAGGDPVVDAGGDGAVEPEVDAAPPGGEAAEGRMTPEQLRNAVRDYADHFRETIAQACDTIRRESDDPVVRRRAHQLKLDASTAVYDIAVLPGSQVAVLNTLVLTSLQTRVAEAYGDEFFPGLGGHLAERAAYLEEQAWKLAARTMSNEQRTELLGIIDGWWADNQEQTDIYYVRLGDLAGYNAGTFLDGVVGNVANLPGAVLDIFVPVNQAGETLDEASELAERMSWLSPRLIILGQWRAEAIVYETLATTEITGALQTAERLTVVAESLPDTIASEREAIINELEAQQGQLKELMNESEDTMGAAESLVASGDTALHSLDEVLVTLDGLVARVQAMHEAQLEDAAAERAVNGGAGGGSAAAEAAAPAEPARPFDITEYTAAIDSLNGVVVDTNTLLQTVDTTTQADALSEKLAVVNEQSTAVIDHTFGRAERLVVFAAVGLAAAGVLIVLVAKLVPGRARKK